MFKSALVQSGQFRVVERSRLHEGVMREKQLNAQGLSSGPSGQQQLREARYLFEGAVTVANASQRQHSGAITIGGLEIGGGRNEDMIAIDVRIVDVAEGDIVDSVTIRQTLGARNVHVAGVGNLIGQVLARKGGTAGSVPDVRLSSGSREGVDGALRAAMDAAVLELARRIQP
jgi:curli biogenesis system outer membrane secretion channel CsgG